MAVPKTHRKRTLNLMLRLNAQERALIEQLSESTGLSLSDVIRQALRREAQRLLGWRLPRSKKPPRARPTKRTPKNERP